MNLTKGHNSLTTLNEITKLHMWKVFKKEHHMALDRNFHIIEELCLFLGFSKQILRISSIT